MKILKEGTEGGSWKKEYTCDGRGNGNNGCGALLEVSGADLFHTGRTYIDQSSDHFITFECPCCTTWNDIKRDDMPTGLWRRVMDMPTRGPSSRGTVSRSALD
jgi:hypothetical protein